MVKGEGELGDIGWHKAIFAAVFRPLSPAQSSDSLMAQGSCPARFRTRMALAFKIESLRVVCLTYD